MIKEIFVVSMDYENQFRKVEKIVVSKETEKMLTFSKYTILGRQFHKLRIGEVVKHNNKRIIVLKSSNEIESGKQKLLDYLIYDKKNEINRMSEQILEEQKTLAILCDLKQSQ